MNNSDKPQLLRLLNSTSEMYQRSLLSTDAIKLYFFALEDFSIDQVKGAITSHIRDPEHGTFYPKVADIVRHILGGQVTTDEVISAARLKETPFGILCRIQIGSFDLENQKDMFYLRQRAQECLDKLPQWKSKALGGEYSKHEISMMLKHDVNPCKPFMNKLQAPQNIAELHRRIEDIRNSDRYKFLLEAPYKDDDEEKNLNADVKVRDFLKDL